MRLRNTIIVLILFALVGGYAFIVSHYSQTEAQPKLIEVKKDDIAKIELDIPTAISCSSATRASPGGW